MQGFKEINPDELQDMQSVGSLRLIDIRSDAELTRGLIQVALHVPLSLLPGKVSERDSTTPNVFYSQSGARSAQACAFFAGKGFNKSYHLQGSASMWVRSGRPLEGRAP